MAPQFEVRRASSGDLPQILEFHRTYQPDLPRLHDSERWIWQFLEVPGSHANPGFYVIDSKGRIEGTLGYIPLRIRIDGRVVHGTFPVNYFVNPSFKGLPALLLMKVVMGLQPITIESNFSKDAKRLLDRLGFLDLGRYVKNYFMPLTRVADDSPNHNPTTNTFLWIVKKTMRNAVSGLWSVAERALGYRGSINTAAVLDPETLPSPIEDEDLVTFDKSFHRLRWRYEQCSAMEPLFVTQSTGRQPAAMAVLCQGGDHGAMQIMDVVGRGPKLHGYGPLVRAILLRAKQAGAASVSAACADPVFGRALRMHGFSVSPSSLGLRAYSGDKDLKSRLAVGDDWRFYLGDSDVI